MTSVRGPQLLSITLTLFLLALQVYQAVAIPNAGSHSLTKRVVYKNGCDGYYTEVLSNALRDVSSMGKAGLHALAWLRRNFDNPDALASKWRILTTLQTFFGDVLPKPGVVSVEDVQERVNVLQGMYGSWNTCTQMGIIQLTKQVP